MLLVGCTKVELCVDPVHPHTGMVRFSYQWNDSTAQRPDSMIVLANRIVGTWHALYFTTPNEGANAGVCHHGQLQSGKYDADSLRVDSLGLFEVKQGDYQFATFCANSNVEFYTFNNLDKYCINDSVRIEDITISYKEYKLNDPLMNHYSSDWKEFNPYSNYIASNVSPIYVATVSPRPVHADEEVTINFTPQSITQNIGFKFSIQKDAEVVIDSIIAEISGIPNSINLDGSIVQDVDYDGNLGIKRTNKMLFGVDMVEYTDTLVDCYGEISVIGLVSNNAPDLAMGAGILQMSIYAHAYDRWGRPNEKCIYARINLYHSLTEMDPPLLTKNEYGQIVHGTKNAVIEIEHMLTIDHDLVIQNAEGGVSMDRWEQIIDDIEIDI